MIPLKSPPNLPPVAEIAKLLSERARTHVGYPYNLAFSYHDFAPLLDLLLNNLGDPYIASNYGVHSREFELACVSWLARLYDAGEDYRGYVTACGTEGNLYGLFLARERYPEGILYFSKDTHYSVGKAARMLKMPYIIVESGISGELNYKDFADKLKSNTGRPAIVVCNLGTTLKGAVDDIARINHILNDLSMQRFIHCDGALASLLIPFIKGARHISFRKHNIDSVAVSGHKFLGVPLPCGIVLTRKSHVDRITSDVEYIGKDTTIMGSRNGLTPILMWYAIAGQGRNFRDEVNGCIHRARYLLSHILEFDDTAFLNPLSTTVVFRRPKSTALCTKWHLPVDGNLSHCIVMQNVVLGILNEFIKELRADSLLRENTVVTISFNSGAKSPLKLL